MPSFLALSAVTIIRFYSMYRPLRVFMTLGLTLLAVAVLIGVRFLTFYLAGNGAGHVQSLILASILSVIGVQVVVVGLIADSISLNRKISEEVLYRMRRSEFGDTPRFPPAE